MYQNPASGRYYTWVKSNGKQIRKSPQRTRRRKITSKEILLPSKAEFASPLQLLAYSGMRLTETT